MLSRFAFAAAFALAGAVSQPALAAHSSDYMKYLVPFPAHKVVGNVYFVGSKGQASYLITTPRGKHPDQFRAGRKPAHDQGQHREAGLQI